MKFRSDDFPHKGRDELADAVESEHPQRLMAVAEQKILSAHHHQDGSPVELHEVGSKEFIRQSMGGSLEGKITGSSFDSNSEEKSLHLQNAKVEYEKKSSQPQQLYSSQQSVTGAASHKQETFMMGCNCGAEWTVTGQSTKKDDSNPAAVKVERYGSEGSGSAGYNLASGAGGEKAEYRAGSGQKSEYRG